MDRVCRICGNGYANIPFRACETMFRTGETFEYLECSRCGCLQICEFPHDLSRYYPADYYALALRSSRRKRSLRRRMQQRAGRGLLNGGSFVDRSLAALWGLPSFVEWAREAGVGLTAAVLDVGSGTGGLLHKMAEFGFTDLTGIDPHIEDDRVCEDGVRLFKRELGTEKGSYDLVMFNHTLEHLPNPLEALEQTRRVLRSGGCTLVRVPVKDSFAWEHYGIDWVQLDAPRHLYLFTKASLRETAEHADFRVERITYDSTPFQFWGSELCRRKIPLNSPETGGGSPRHQFSKSELRLFRRRTEQLNREGRGDTACFYLRKL